MSAVEMRAAVHEMIDEIDSKMLGAIYAMLGAYQEEQAEKGEAIIGYEIDGTPITVSAFLKQADESMAAVERGEYITLEELEKESKEWLTRTK